MGLRVVIPVAGVGTRLRPFTHTLPKVLVPVAGKPMLGHILDELKNYDVEEVTLIIGYFGEKVREYVTKSFPFKFRFVVQETMEGLGHAIWLSAPGYRESNEPLFIVLGDTIFDADFSSILGSDENWIGVKEVEDPRRFGVVVMEGDKIKDMVEKPEVPPSNLAVVGIYYFKDSALLYQCLDEIVEKDIRTKGEIQLTDGLRRMLERGAVMKPFSIKGWLDCGKAETLLETNRLLLDRLHAQGKLTAPATNGSTIIHPPVAFEGKATLENAIIGPYVSVGDGAVLRDSIVSDSIIADNAEVSKALLQGSIIADNAKVMGHAYQLNVGDASEVQIS